MDPMFKSSRFVKIVSIVLIQTFLSSNISFGLSVRQQSPHTKQEMLSPTIQMNSNIFSEAMKGMVNDKVNAGQKELTEDEINQMVESLLRQHPAIYEISQQLDISDIEQLPQVMAQLKVKYAEGLDKMTAGEARLLFQYFEREGDDAFAESAEIGINYFKRAIFFAGKANAWIVSEDDSSWKNEISLIGGKIANSLELKEGSLEVPPFFGITAVFQKYVWIYNNILGKMRDIAFEVDPQDDIGTSFAEKQFSELIDKTALPEDLNNLMERSLRDLADQEGYVLTTEEAEAQNKEILEVIFRSSQGLEDRPGIPSAGIGESIPGIGINNAIPIFKKVAASAYISKALIYRDKIAMYTWLMEKVSMEDLQHFVNLLEKRRDKNKKIKIAGINREFGAILDDLKENLDLNRRDRKEFIYVSTIRIQALLDVLRNAGIKDKIVDKLMRELKKVRTDSLDPARVGGGIQTQIMRDSLISAVGFAVDKATGWTGAANDLRSVEFDSAFGRGELIVQGSIIGDHHKIVINTKTGVAKIVEKSCGSKIAKLCRGIPGQKYLVWKDIKNGVTEEIIAVEGKQYLMVTSKEERQKYALTDEQAIEMARKILESDFVHNKPKGGNPIPVDMEACFYMKNGKLLYSIVQKRDTTAKDGFDYEDPDNIKLASTEPNPAQADAAQEQGHLVARGFGTQNAASGESVWVEEVSGSRVKAAVREVMKSLDLSKGIESIKELIPASHPNLYSQAEYKKLVDDMLNDLKIAKSGIQEDFDVNGLAIDQARIIQKILSEDYDVGTTRNELHQVLNGYFSEEDVQRIESGIEKLYMYANDLENRLKLYATIISLNLFSKVKGSLTDAFIEERTSFLERNILDRQFIAVKNKIKGGFVTRIDLSFAIKDINASAIWANLLKAEIIDNEGKGEIQDVFRNMSSVKEFKAYMLKKAQSPFSDEQFESIFDFLKKALERKKVTLVAPETNPNFNDIMQFVSQNGGSTVTLQGGRSAHAVIIAIQFGYCVVGGTSFSNKELLNRIKQGEPIALTVDGNKGFVYDIPMSISQFSSINQVARWAMTQFGGDIGLITNSTVEMKKFARYFAKWIVPVDEKMYPQLKGKKTTGAYGVSLDRTEEVVIEMGIAFRAAFAYDRLLEGDKLDESKLTASQLSDIQKVRGAPQLIKDIQEQVNADGQISAVDYLRHHLSSHFLQMVVTTVPGQVVQVREMDLKLREIVKTQKGAELFYNNEEASMIGFRGIGHEVDPENIEGLELQMMAMSDAIGDAQELGNVGDLGFFFVFIRRLLDDPQYGKSDLQKGLDKILELRRQGKIKHLPKQIGAMFELNINALLAEELNATLRDFREQVKKEFGEDIITFISYGTNDLTQSIKGSRDEGRYNSLDFVMPSGKIIKGYKVFNEGDKAVTDTLKHGAIVAKKYGNKVGLCGEALNNLINSGLPEDIDAAQDIIMLLDSGGTSVKIVPKAVKLRGDAFLAKSSIPSEVAENAEVIIKGEKLIAKGAAQRIAVFIRSAKDFAVEHVVWRDGKKRKDVSMIPKTVEGDVIIVSSKVEINDEFLKIIARRDGAASGIVIVDEGNGFDKMKEVISSANIPSMVVGPEIYGLIKDLGKYVFDFARGSIYTSEGISFNIEKPIDDTAYANINYDANPEEVKLKTVNMDDVYTELGIHPLALLLYAYESNELENPVVEVIENGREITKRDLLFSQHRIPMDESKFPEMYKDVALLIAKYDVDSVRELIAKVFKQHIAKAKSELAKGEMLAFKTSDGDAWFFEGLKWGQRDTGLELNVFNVPIDLRGLAKTISPGYDEIFKMFLDIVEESKLNVQFAYVQDIGILNFGFQFLKEYGISPEEDKIKIGMEVSTSHNFIVAKDYYKNLDLSFVSVDREKLLMNVALANMDYRTNVRQYDGSERLLINSDDLSYQVALNKAEAMLKTAMVNAGVVLAMTDKYVQSKADSGKISAFEQGIVSTVDGAKLEYELVSPAI